MLFCALTVNLLKVLKKPYGLKFRPGPTDRPNVMAKWFICENEEVSGPFDTEVLERKIEAGSLSSQCLIWGHPQTEWKSPSWWRSNLHDLMSSQRRPKMEKLWHYVINEVSHGPMKRQELVETLKDLDEKTEVLVWTNGMDDWVSLFDVDDLLQEIGFSRRQHPRANIEGQVVVEQNGQSFIGQLKTVSAGGCGFIGSKEIDSGSEIKVTIKSEAFYKEVRAQAEVRYISESGFTGLKFLGINQEDKAAIINYVRSELAKAQTKKSA